MSLNYERRFVTQVVQCTEVILHNYSINRLTGSMLCARTVLYPQ